MSLSTPSYRAFAEGQIALERALFCLECEIIFAGTAHCPRCADGAVWPLDQWLPSARASAPALLYGSGRVPNRGLHIVYLAENLSNE